MSSEGEEKDAPDWSGAIQSAQSAITEAGDEEDGEEVNVVMGGGLATASGAAEADSEELPYVVLLHAAARTVQSGEISMDEFVEGVKKLDAIADNALKIYAIPAVKNDLPAKLTDHQNAIVSALEEQIHRLKEGLAKMLAYPDTRDVGELESGLHAAVQSLYASRGIQKKADAEYAAIMQREKDEKAQRAQKGAAAESESDAPVDERVG